MQSSVNTSVVNVYMAKWPKGSEIENKFNLHIAVATCEQTNEEPTTPKLTATHPGTEVGNGLNAKK